MDGAPVTHEQLRKVILAFMDSPEFADDRRRLEFFDRLLEAWRRENEQGGNGLFTKLCEMGFVR